MCGIAGIFASHQTRVTYKELKDMTDVIVHRGPDGEGHWINPEERVGLGHRRLSIIDLSINASQPMHYMNGRYTVTFNGEIYNYVELREDLLRVGYKFQSSSDTEVLLALYDQKKEKCLKELNGMFAFAIWDEVEKTLFCARDRFGEKPFHYCVREGRFIFASEIKQFWALGIKKEVDDEKLNRYIDEDEVFNDRAPERTFFKGIFSLPAASYLICKPDINFRIYNYWNLNGVKVIEGIKFEEACRQFETFFQNSIKLRLRSDVPVGSSLSGGLDSSAIVHTVNKYFHDSRRDQCTFSARFKNYEKDEGVYIDSVLAQCSDIKRFDVFLDQEQFENEIAKIVQHQDEPFQSASIFAQYSVMKLAKKNDVSVLLDGQGADELLGGYEPLYKFYLKQLFFNKPSWYKTEVRHYNNLHGHKHGEVDLEGGDNIINKTKRRFKQLARIQQPVGTGYFSGILRQYITGGQLQQLLRYADRNSMAHSVEVRLPFLDHELVEFVFSLPDEFKLQKGWPKYLLRKTFDGKLPDNIVWRKDKVGFETPESTFLQSDIAN